MKSVTLLSSFVSVVLLGAVAWARPQDEEQKPVEPATRSESAVQKQVDEPGRDAVVAPTAHEASSAAAASPTSKPTLTYGAFTVAPYLAIAGGLKGDHVVDKSGEDKDDRFVTFAVGRFGLLGSWGNIVTVQSELMASGGYGLHGTSAYEGQAALQVRQQMIRLTLDPVTVEVGRIVDEASVDFISAHVQDTLIQDTATRDPLLYSGYNLGNGVRATVVVYRGLRLGLTLNAGNPVSTTSTLSVGGTYPPFDRLYTQAYQAVNQGPNNFPDDTFHSMVLTPAILYASDIVDAKLAVQGFDVDTDTNKGGNDHVRGFNARGTVRMKIADARVVPFASAAETLNDTLDPNDLSRRSPKRYRALNFGGGVDVNVARRFPGFPDSADGIGAMFQQVQFHIGDDVVTTLRYANLGGTYWLTPNVAIDGRLTSWLQFQNGAKAFGERNVIVGLRAVVP